MRAFVPCLLTVSGSGGRHGKEYERRSHQQEGSICRWQSASKSEVEQGCEDGRRVGFDATPQQKEVAAKLGRGLTRPMPAPAAASVTVHRSGRRRADRSAGSAPAPRRPGLPGRGAAPRRVSRGWPASRPSRHGGHSRAQFRVSPGRLGRHSRARAWARASCLGVSWLATRSRASTVFSRRSRSAAGVRAAARVSHM